MGKPNPEYLRQYEFCRRMAGKAKLADLKLAWQDLAAKWLGLAQSRLRLSETRKAVGPASGPGPQLKRFYRI